LKRWLGRALSARAYMALSGTSSVEERREQRLSVDRGYAILWTAASCDTARSNRSPRGGLRRGVDDSLGVCASWEKSGQACLPAS
jgi:hypothetical protein